MGHTPTRTHGARSISSLRTSTFGKDWKTNGVLKASNSSSSFFHHRREIQQHESTQVPMIIHYITLCLYRKDPSSPEAGSLVV
jgi:hypothetical protein